MKVIILDTRITASGIAALTLAKPDGSPMPAFTAGAHIDVHLPGGLVRQYSLCNGPDERQVFRLGVLLEPVSRGGSRAMHALGQGATLEIGEPRNHFCLADGQDRAVLVAGGIGITPLLSMAEHLLRTGTPFDLHYCVRSSDRIAFAERLSGSDLAPHVHIHADALPDTRFDPLRDLPPAAPGTHLYVCGPQGFIEWVLGAAASCAWLTHNLHREFFGQTETAAANAPFRIRLARSGAVVEVRADQSASQALKEHGVELETSCEQGVCGKCLTRVLDGTPDHRDVYLTDAERDSNTLFTPCCSRALSPFLLVDL
ncbi:PDR/VanB family oxidoreductase [Paraburkholderia oxyphila]|uniref:PDR/VanB family oxidoreductase n=1 Tax=Paraburkholderia oxyphila TaxID=614212 RepID=UPI0005B79905|nr:PDR/VanB family oxidoreductase [Paraburkholderia oxyphila]